VVVGDVHISRIYFRPRLIICTSRKVHVTLYLQLPKKKRYVRSASNPMRTERRRYDEMQEVGRSSLGFLFLIQFIT
jgi:hypothetical protein